jgi:hypothetical protein
MFRCGTLRNWRGLLICQSQVCVRVSGRTVANEDRPDRYSDRCWRCGKSDAWANRYEEICKAIRTIEWPIGSGSFTLYDESGKKRGMGNGVKPIKMACMARLKDDFGWCLESGIQVGTEKLKGRVDATCPMGDGVLAIEWETGNISSSHRALNKMCLGMLKGSLIGGVLILPTRNMYRYLTDRVGNIAEVEPYFPLWGALPIAKGILTVVVIEHDAVSRDVPRIPKGTDGRAMQ